MTNTISYPGSKRTCVPRLLDHVGAGDLLVSPFVGMAALEVAALEARRFRRAILGDASPHVVAVLTGIQASPEDVYRIQMDVRATIAAGAPDERADLLRAAQDKIAEALAAGDRALAAGLILGANCYSFSRLWRVNSAGRINVPCDARGRPPASLATVRRYHRALQRAEVRLASWKWIRDCGPATTFCDPPYLGPGGFRQYTAAGWSEADAAALADCLAELPGRVVVCEQTPGGGPLYEERLSARRPVRVHVFGRQRNVRGDHLSTRTEVTLVAVGRTKMLHARYNGVSS